MSRSRASRTAGLERGIQRLTVVGAREDILMVRRREFALCQDFTAGSRDCAGQPLLAIIHPLQGCLGHAQRYAR